VLDLSEESLLWRAPEADLGPIAELAFPKLRHQREPGQISSPEERQRRAVELGKFVTKPEHMRYFGLLKPNISGTPRIDRPVVESIRTLRRIGPDDTVNFDLVAEVTQRRRVGNNRWFYGGATVIIDSTGNVRYAIVKSVDSARREARFAKHLAAKPAVYDRLFTTDEPRTRTGMLLQHLHRK
jgi:hypothetical protein